METFPRLYSYVFDKGVPQDPDAPPRCWPGDPLGQQICHTTDIAEVSFDSQTSCDLCRSFHRFLDGPTSVGSLTTKPTLFPLRNT